jgi:hypothetical protein
VTHQRQELGLRVARGLAFRGADGQPGSTAVTPPDRCMTDDDSRSIDREFAAVFLAGDDERDTVIAEDLRARRMGINAVPCFIVNGAYAISGAQEPEAFFPLFDLASFGQAAE